MKLNAQEDAEMEDSAMKDVSASAQMDFMDHTVRKVIIKKKRILNCLLHYELNKTVATAH